MDQNTRQPKKDLPSPKPDPIPPYQEFLEEHGEKQKPPTTLSNQESLAEFPYLLGVCLWDILADNNDLQLPSDEIAHLGSFRMVGGLIPDHHNHTPPSAPTFDYMDFYMGAGILTERADLTPIYHFLFHRLKNTHHDWICDHTSLGLVRFAKPRDTSL